MAKKISTVLQKNAYGHISVCSCCSDWQLHFGNVLIQMPVQGFQNLVVVLDEMTQRHGIEVASNLCGQPIMIRTPQNNMYLKLSAEEFLGLRELIDGALFLVEVKRLINGE